MTNRVTQPRFELSLNNRTIALISVGVLAFLVVVFALGIVVGRGMSKIESGDDLATYEVANADAIVINGEGLEADEEAPAGEEGIREEALTEPETMVEHRDGVAYGFYDPEQGEPAALPAAPPVALPPAPAPIAPEPEAPPLAFVEPAAPAPQDVRPAIPAPKVSETGKTLYYTIQVGAFETPSEASQLEKRLLGKSLAAYTVQATVRGKLWHRVRVGRFADKAGAEAMAAAIREREGLKTFIDLVVE